MRYFFHIKSGVALISDLEGTEFPSEQAAIMEAHMVARELIGSRLIDGRPVDWTSSVNVSDEVDTTIGTVSFLEAAGLSESFTPTA